MTRSTLRANWFVERRNGAAYVPFASFGVGPASAGADAGLLFEANLVGDNQEIFRLYFCGVRARVAANVKVEGAPSAWDARQRSPINWQPHAARSAESFAGPGTITRATIVGNAGLLLSFCDPLASSAIGPVTMIIGGTIDVLNRSWRDQAFCVVVAQDGSTPQLDGARGFWYVQ